MSGKELEGEPCQREVRAAALESVGRGAAFSFSTGDLASWFTRYGFTLNTISSATIRPTCLIYAPFFSLRGLQALQNPMNFLWDSKRMWALASECLRGSCLCLISYGTKESGWPSGSPIFPLVGVGRAYTQDCCARLYTFAWHMASTQKTSTDIAKSSLLQYLCDGLFTLFLYCHYFLIWIRPVAEF